MTLGLSKINVVIVIKAVYVMLMHFYDFNFLTRCLLSRTNTHKYCIYPMMSYCTSINIAGFFQFSNS